MLGDEPFEETPLRVPVVDQVIIGFDEKVSRCFEPEARTMILGVLKTLEERGFPTTVLKPFIKASPDKELSFAFISVRLDRGTLEALQEEVRRNKEFYPTIAWVERNAPVALLAFADPLVRQQWALPKIGVTDPWTVSPPGAPNPAKTILAIIDSGVRRPGGTLHEDLGLVEPGGGVDTDGHGTFLAGAMAAEPNAKGIASPIPKTWNISLLSVKFFSPREPPHAFNAAAAIALAALAGAKVINASWHVPPGDNGLSTLAFVIGLVSAKSLVVFAAGNDGTDNDQYPTYPANFGGAPWLAGRALTVMATDYDDGKAFFSNYSKNIVDIGAPGFQILTTARYLLPPARYAGFSGTSAAAAYVSSGAALMFALHPANWDGAGAPAWTPGDVVQHLKASADTIDHLKIACIGGKRLNLGRAVYGPLRMIAPGQDDELNVGVTTVIAWSNKYNNPKFTKVKIEFHDGAAWSVLKASTDNDGLFQWKPTAGQVTSTGRIRITPVKGNFPVVSDPFKVVP
jgi:subtilisin family serine protease